MSKQEERKALSVTEASNMIGVHPTTIRRAIQRKELKAFKLTTKKNGMYRIHVDELKKLFGGSLMKSIKKNENTKWSKQKQKIELRLPP